MPTKKKRDWTDLLAKAIVVAFIIIVLAVAFVIRLWITGGDLPCVFSPDPALCAAVKHHA